MEAKRLRELGLCSALHLHELGLDIGVVRKVGATINVDGKALGCLALLRASFYELKVARDPHKSTFTSLVGLP